MYEMKKLILIFNLYCFPFRGIMTVLYCLPSLRNNILSPPPPPPPTSSELAPPFCDASRTANRQPESVKVGPMGDSHIDSANIERGHFIRVAK